MAKFCSSCGAPLEEGMRFCDKCGASQEVNQQSSNVASKATIQISRKWRLLNFMFADEVYIDGVKIGTVSNGQTKTFEVNPGAHKLQLKMTYPLITVFVRSKVVDFNIEKGQTLKFKRDYSFGARMPIIGNFTCLLYGFKIISIEQDNH